MLFRKAVSVIALLVLVGVAVVAQSAGQKTNQKTTATAKTAQPAVPVRQSAEVTCPNVLGTGISTKHVFCDVTTGSDPAVGILIQIPPHRGTATLMFDLHNRHMYSDEQVKAKTAFAHYTAGIGVFTLDNTLITRAAVDSEFRTSKDVLDWIGGGAGPGGRKAVVPTGTEQVVVDIPADVTTVSVLGERLTVVKSVTDKDGTKVYAKPGLPIATIDDVVVEYRPAPKPAPPAKANTTKKTKKK